MTDEFQDTSQSDIRTNETVSRISRPESSGETADSDEQIPPGRSDSAEPTSFRHSASRTTSTSADEKATGRATSSRSARPHTSMVLTCNDDLRLVIVDEIGCTTQDRSRHIHKYAKHELCYISQYRSTPKIGFSRAARDISKPVPKRSPRKQSQLYYADAWKEEDVPRKPVQGGKFGKNQRKHFSEFREAYPSKSMETIRYGRESPGPTAVDPIAVWDRTYDGNTGRVPNAFRGRTTFGTGPMCHQLKRTLEGPGPAGLALPRRPKMGGGRFNREPSLTEFDRKIRAAKDLPGPASHNIRLDKHVPGGRFNMSRPKTNIEWEMLRAKDIPSAADTTTSRAWGFTGSSRTTGTHIMPRGGRIMHQPAVVGRSKVVTGGQTLIRSLAAEALDNTPGPGYYSVDF